MCVCRIVHPGKGGRQEDKYPLHETITSKGYTMLNTATRLLFIKNTVSHYDFDQGTALCVCVCVCVCDLVVCVCVI